MCFAMRMYETSDRGHKFSGGLNYLATYSASSLELVCHEFETLHGHTNSLFTPEDLPNRVDYR